MRLKQYLMEAEQMLKAWKFYVAKNSYLKAAVDLLNRIESLGKYDAYIVGGAVRDIILGDKIGDIDIATNCPVEVLEKNFKTHDIGQSKTFGVVTIKHKGHDFEVANFRKDGKYTDGRRPEKVNIVGSFQDDAARRDFSINAMAVDKNGRIIDYFDGMKAIQNKVIKTVGNPYERFSEDYLRMMRTARFAAKLGFDIDKETAKAAKKLSKNILDLAPERIKDELIKSAKMSGDKFANYILILDKIGLLKHILPSVVNLKWFRENLQHHPETRGKGGTVFAHTLEAVRKIGADQPLAMLATLLHDVGKGVSFSQKEGLPKYLGHAKASIDLVDSLARRLKMSNKEREALIFAVGNHMKFHSILQMKPSKIAKIVSDDNWDVLVQVAKADEKARGEEFKYQGSFEKTVEKAIEIKNKYNSRELQQRINLVSGNHIMAITGLKPGPLVGKIKNKVTEMILDDEIDSSEVDDAIRRIYNEIQ